MSEGKFCNVCRAKVARGSGVWLYGGMVFAVHEPRSPLSAFVKCLWLHEGAGPAHAKERVLPTGTMELVFSLREECLSVCDPENTDVVHRLGGSIVIGAHSDFFVIDTTQQSAVMGVHFKPGGAFPFFEAPAGELRNQHLSLEFFWGREASRLREQLCEAPTPRKKFELMEGALLKRALRPLSRRQDILFALRELELEPHVSVISDVISRTSLSHRRFIEVFSDEVGLTPKVFCRIGRFQKVLRLLHTGREVDWAEVALSCGYYEQAHFNRDFRAFSGVNPSRYLANRTEHLNHLPLGER